MLSSQKQLGIDLQAASTVIEIHHCVCNEARPGAQSALLHMLCNVYSSVFVHACRMYDRIRI